MTSDGTANSRIAGAKQHSEGTLIADRRLPAAGSETTQTDPRDAQIADPTSVWPQT
jgi:hypothetical protein